MPDRIDPSERALDQPGSADEQTLRHALLFALVVVGIGFGVAYYGDVPLRAFPPFSTFHAGFVLHVDAIIGFLLLGQFRYRRRPIYAALASAYLFTSLIMAPYLLSFPDALKASGQIIGGEQSAAWIWIAWHTVFPTIVGGSLLLHWRDGERLTPAHRVSAVSWLAIASALLLAIAVTLLVTVAHDQLPPLLDGAAQHVAWRKPFYVLGTTALLITAAAAWLCWHQARQRQTLLHLWLAVTLMIFFADIMVSLSSSTRYSVGWYFGRVEAMVATSLLLMLFLGELNHLYHRLASTMNALLGSNQRLAAILQEKEALVTNLQHSEAQIRQLAYYDSLTELPNRRLLLDRLGQALTQASRHRTSMAVMFIDLDHFKRVNDSLGHDAGDKLLVHVARR
ncbi:MAG: sensor domain-containing diguanylate cyclase, partial [Propionivibrio sp.]